MKKHYTDLLQAKSGAPQPEVEAPVATPPTPAAVPLDEINPDEVIIRRAKREDLNRMAELISTGTKGALQPDLSAMMENLFSRAYIVALAKDYVVGMMGWQAENLVAGLQDFYVLRDDLWATIGQKMLDKVHEEINNLSCEVSLIFITNPTGQKPIEFLESQGYEQFESKNLIPDWRSLRWL